MKYNLLRLSLAAVARSGRIMHLAPPEQSFGNGPRSMSGASLPQGNIFCHSHLWCLRFIFLAYTELISSHTSSHRSLDEKLRGWEICWLSNLQPSAFAQSNKLNEQQRVRCSLIRPGFSLSHKHSGWLLGLYVAPEDDLQTSLWKHWRVFNLQSIVFFAKTPLRHRMREYRK